MPIKKKYLFPIIYLILLCVALATNSEGLLMLLGIHQSFLFLALDIYFETRVNSIGGISVYLFIYLIGLWQYFLLGYFVDKITDWFRFKTYSD